MRKSDFRSRNLSLLSLAAIYLVLVVYHLISEAFVLENQIFLLSIMLPFLLLGGILDFIVSRNTVLPKNYRTFTQLLPLGVFALFGASFLLEAADRPDYECFQFILWIFLSIPFFIATYRKEGHKNRMIFSMLSTALVFAAYLYLTTLTDELVEGNGIVVYLITYFCMYYSASGFHKLPFISTILGTLNAIALLVLWKSPMTDAAKLYGWDYDIALNFEFLMMVSLGFSIMLSLLSVIKKPIAEPVAQVNKMKG